MGGATNGVIAVIKHIRGYPVQTTIPPSQPWHIQHITSKDIINGINLNRGVEAVSWDLLNLHKGNFGTHHIPSAPGGDGNAS